MIPAEINSFSISGRANFSILPCAGGNSISGLEPYFHKAPTKIIPKQLDAYHVVPPIIQDLRPTSSAVNRESNDEDTKENLI